MRAGAAATGVGPAREAPPAPGRRPASTATAAAQDPVLTAPTPAKGPDEVPARAQTASTHAAPDSRATPASDPVDRAEDPATTGSDGDTVDTEPDSDTVDTEVLPTSEVLASRRALRHSSEASPSRRALRHTPRPPARAPHGRSWAPRAAVLGAMGTLTIVAPLTGFASPDGETAGAVSAVAPQKSILDALDAQVAALAPPVPASLLKDPAASSRATVLQTSRAADRNALTCAPLDGASGARAAVTERTEQLVRPVAEGASRISSNYGNRSHPLSGTYGFHTGTDFAAPLGTPIHAVANGTVEYVGTGKDGRSNMLVILRHEIGGQTVYSWYVHMYRDGIHVVEGQEVTAGDVIAEVGNNGNSTGPHLHFEIHLDDQGTTTDPLTWLEQNGAVEMAALC